MVPPGSAISGFFDFFGVSSSSPFSNFLLSGFRCMVYEYVVPYVHKLDVLDTTMIFNIADSRFIEASKINKDNGMVVYDLGYGEHLVLHLKCNGDQCSFDADLVGVYENKKGEVYLERLDHYSTTLSRFSVSMVPTTKWAPAILRCFFMCLRPFDIPDEWYSPQDICQIIEKIATFFNEYLYEYDDEYE
jgi:hypothetical protein